MSVDLVVADCCRPLHENGMTKADARATAALFKALSDPARVRIVNLLATRDEPACVCQLTGPLGLSQPTVSHHLKKLVKAGLLEREQRGTWAYYSLDRDAFRQLATVTEMEAVR